MSCQCQDCGRKYTVDLLVPDDLWNRIKPKGKPPRSWITMRGMYYESD